MKRNPFVSFVLAVAGCGFLVPDSTPCFLFALTLFGLAGLLVSYPSRGNSDA